MTDKDKDAGFLIFLFPSFPQAFRGNPESFIFTNDGGGGFGLTGAHNLLRLGVRSAILDDLKREQFLPVSMKPIVSEFSLRGRLCR